MSPPRRWKAWLLGLASCAPTPDVDPRCSLTEPPGDIEAVIAAIDTLPRPLQLPCFLAALPRPLSIVATDDVFSAQPAMGSRSPRIFLLSPGLSMSVVPEGTGRPLLELGERTDDPSQSLKAEIHFPILEPLSPDEPFTRIEDPSRQGTSCGVCHGLEHDLGGGRFASRALQPAPFTLIGVEHLIEEALGCDPLLEPDRCAMLEALFLSGQVDQASFPEGYDTIYDPR